MLMMENLEKRGVHTYHNALRETKTMDELYFYTSNDRVTVIGLHDVDVIMHF